VFPETGQDFMDMLGMCLGVIGIDQDVIEIVDNTYVEEVRKDVVHEMLESCWCVNKSKRHD
jgi:hypothetical protein